MFDEAQVLAHAPLASQLLGRLGVAESFHMPGNAGGTIFSDALSARFFRSDTTELDSTGDLNDPDGAVAEAQSLAADVWGAAFTFFLTGGATEGLQTLLLAFCGKGGRLLLGPACHRSILFAASLFDIRLTVLPGTVATDPAVDRGDIASKGQVESKSVEYGLPPTSPLPQLAPAELERTLADLSTQGDLPDAVLVTSPDYYGFTADIRSLGEICRSYGLPLLVDEAHGAHFAFAAPGLLPLPAIQDGAAAVVQSAHKTLPALTPAALIHLASDLPVDLADRVAACLRMVRTSSPSLLIAQTIDYARSLMELEGGGCIGQTIDRLYQVFGAVEAFPYFTFARSPVSPHQPLRSPLESGPEYRLSLPALPEGETGTCGKALQGRSEVVRQDLLRLVIDTTAVAPAPLLASGLAEVGIEVEFADFCRLVLIVSPFCSRDSLYKLRDSLISLAGTYSFSPGEQEAMLHLDETLSRTYAQGHPFPRADWLMPDKADLVEVVALTAAEGRCLACSPTPYPPGIPLFWPGDRLSLEACELLAKIPTVGYSCQYLSAFSSDRLLVIKRGHEKQDSSGKAN